MSSVYSVRFCQTEGGGPASFTVPAGRVAVLRCVTAYNYTTSNQWFNVIHGPSNLVVLTRVIAATDPNPGEKTFIYDLRYVFTAGESITINTEAGGVHVSCSGYLFTV